MASQEMSQAPWRKSKATARSLTAKNGPAGVETTVVEGRKPWLQEMPPLCEVAQPMLQEPPLKMRPTWNVATTVEPKAKVSGSTSVACASGGLPPVQPV